MKRFQSWDGRGWAMVIGICRPISLDNSGAGPAYLQWVRVGGLDIFFLWWIIPLFFFRLPWRQLD